MIVLDKIASNQPEINPRRAIGISLIATIIVLFVLTLGMFLISPPLTVDVTEGSSHIVFSAQRRTVALSGDCLTVSWAVDGIKEVYINGKATVGSDSKQFCITTDSATQPRLRIVFNDGSEKEYLLPVSILVRNPLFTLVIALILIMSVLALVVLIFPVLSRLAVYLKQPLRLIELIIVSAVLLYGLGEIAIRLYLSHF